MYGGEQGKVSQDMWARTPFTQQPLLSEFGYLALGKKAREVLGSECFLLHGPTKIPPPWTGKYAAQLLCSLTIPEEIRVANPVFTPLKMEDFI